MDEKTPNPQDPHALQAPGLGVPEQSKIMTRGERVLQPVSPDMVNPAPLATLANSEIPTPTTPSVVVSKPAQVAPQLPVNGGAAVTNSGYNPMAGRGFVTGSSLRQQKTPLPIGIYVIAVFSLLAFVSGFFDTSQMSLIYIFIMFFNLLVAVGLFMRLETARKAMFWVSGLVLVLATMSVVMMVMLQQRIQRVRTNYQIAISKIDRNQLTSSQKEQLAGLETTMVTQEKQVGKAITFTYLKLGVSAVEAMVVMIYLARPKVKEVFEIRN